MEQFPVGSVVEVHGLTLKQFHGLNKTSGEVLGVDESHADRVVVALPSGPTPLLPRNLRIAREQRCRKGHRMRVTHFSGGEYASGWACDACYALGEGGRWFCSECDFDRCFKCTPPPEEPVPSPSPKIALGTGIARKAAVSENGADHSPQSARSAPARPGRIAGFAAPHAPADEADLAAQNRELKRLLVKARDKLDLVTNSPRKPNPWEPPPTEFHDRPATSPRTVVFSSAETVRNLRSTTPEPRPQRAGPAPEATNALTRAQQAVRRLEREIEAKNDAIQKLTAENDELKQAAAAREAEALEAKKLAAGKREPFYVADDPSVRGTAAGVTTAIEGAVTRGGPEGFVRKSDRSLEKCVSTAARTVSQLVARVRELQEDGLVAELLRRAQNQTGSRLYASRIDLVLSVARQALRDIEPALKLSRANSLRNGSAAEESNRPRSGSGGSRRGRSGSLSSRDRGGGGGAVTPRGAPPPPSAPPSSRVRNLSPASQSSNGNGSYGIRPRQRQLRRNHSASSSAGSDGIAPE
eukprot:gene16220-24860_t